MADTAALVVALSAQVTKFEKDMKQALDIADKRTKDIENVFSKMNDAITNQLNTLAATTARTFGPLGGLIGGLGPVGLGVAATIGSLIAVFVTVTDKIDKFVEKAKALKDTAETTGLTATQLKALSVAGREVGVEFETTERGLVRFSTAFDELRTKGTGPLFEALRRFPGLAKQVAQAADVSEAINLVSNAVAGLADQQEKLGVSAAFVGKRGAGEFLRLFQIIGQRGLLDAVNEEFDQTIETITKLSRQIEDLKRQRDELFKPLAIPALEAEKAYHQKLLDIQRTFVEIIRQRDRLSAEGFGTEAIPLAPAPTTGGRRTEAAAEAAAFLPVLDKTITKSSQLSEVSDEWTKKVLAGLLVDINKMNQWIGLMGDAVTQTDRLVQKQNQLTAAVLQKELTPEEANRAIIAFLRSEQAATEALRERIGIATVQERIDERLAQLAADKLKFNLSDNDEARAKLIIITEEQNRRQAILDQFHILTQEQSTQLKINQAIVALTREQQDSAANRAKTESEIRLQADQAKESDKERLGIATDEEILQTRLNDLYSKAAYFGYTQLQQDQARLNIQKEAVDVSEQQQIKRAALPDLKRLELDSSSLAKNIDRTLVSSFNNFENAMADVAVGTVKLSEAFKKLADSIIRDLVRMALRLSVLAPLERLLGGLFSPLATPFGTSLSGSNNPGWFAPLSAGTFISGPGARQRGGPVMAGSPYIVGEHGPELFVPKSAGNIVPHQVTSSSRSTAGELKVIVNNYASGQTETTQERRQGPTGEELIIGIVKRVTASGELDSANRGRFALRAQKVR